MNAQTRRKIEDALKKNGRPAILSSLPVPAAFTPDAIAESILAGEHIFSIKQVMVMTGLCFNSVVNHLKGKPGWLRTPGGAIRVTESLVRDYLTGLAAKGLEDSA
jgi:hypothetical protein